MLRSKCASVLGILHSPSMCCEKTFHAKKILVLNMADRHHAGGGALEGCPAQEECLYRETDLSLFLSGIPYTHTQVGYPIGMRVGEGHAIVSRDVSLVKMRNFPEIVVGMRDIMVDVISMAGVDLRTFQSGIFHPFEDNHKNMMEKTVLSLLRIAAILKYTILDLSALSCGTFGCPINEVAKIFHAAIHSPEFAERFKVIYFSIFTTSYMTEKSLENFKGMEAIFKNDDDHFKEKFIPV
jgi:uncharacterized protein (TIGR02452 family)